MLPADSVSVLAVDGEVIFSISLLDVDTLFDKALVDSLLYSKFKLVAKSFLDLVGPFVSIFGFA